MVIDARAQRIHALTEAAAVTAAEVKNLNIEIARVKSAIEAVERRRRWRRIRAVRDRAGEGVRTVDVISSAELLALAVRGPEEIPEKADTLAAAVIAKSIVTDVLTSLGRFAPPQKRRRT